MGILVGEVHIDDFQATIERWQIEPPPRIINTAEHGSSSGVHRALPSGQNSFRAITSIVASTPEKQAKEKDSVCSVRKQPARSRVDP